MNLCITRPAGIALLALGLVVQRSHAAVEPGAPLQMECVVVGADGKPVVGTRVVATQKDEVIAEGSTDAAGLWRFSFAPPEHIERVHVVIVANGGSQGVGVGTGFASKPWGELKPVKVLLLPRAEFRAKVLTPEGTPAAGLEVWVASIGSKVPPSRVGLERPAIPGVDLFASVPPLPGGLWKAVTDADGRCVIANLPAGAHLYVQHTDSRWAQLDGKHHYLLDNAAKADGEERTLQLKVAGEITGRIVLPDGTPAAGTTVRIIEHVPYVVAYGGEVTAAADGRFFIQQVPASAYKLRYQAEPPLHEKWVGAEKTDVAVKAGEVTALGDLMMSEAAVVTARVLDAETGTELQDPLIFRLAAGSHSLRCLPNRDVLSRYHAPRYNEAVAVDVKAGERKQIEFALEPVKQSDIIKGVVTNEAGTPENGALASLIHQGLLFPPPPFETGPDGAFEFRRPRGVRGLIVFASNADGAISDRHQAAADEPLKVVLRQDGFARATGEVLNEMGDPVAGAKVSWTDSAAVSGSSNAPFPQEVVTDAEGQFEFPRLWVGSHPIFFCSAPGYGGGSLRDEVLAANCTTKLRFQLKRTTEVVAGRLVDAQGQPVPEVVVYASGDGQPSGVRATTDSAGRFTLQNLSSGRVFVRAVVTTPEYRREASQWAKGGQTDVRLVLPAGDATLAGTVLDHQGKPIAGATLQSFERGVKTQTDSEGRFSLKGLTEGWFRVEVTAPRVASARGFVEHSTRVKAGMRDVKIALPERTRETLERPLNPLDLIGTEAAELQVATWLNSRPLPAKAEGRVRIVDFWGIQCAPCLAAFPKVQAFWAQHQAQGLELIALTSYPELEVREFLAKHPDYRFPIGIAPEDTAAWSDYDVRGVPTYVVINREGKIIHKSHDWKEAAEAALNAMQP